MAARPFMLSEIKENNLESDCVMDLLHGRNAPYITLRNMFLFNMKSKMVVTAGENFMGEYFENNYFLNPLNH